MNLNLSKNKLPDDELEENELSSTQEHFKCSALATLQRLNERINEDSFENPILVVNENIETGNNCVDKLHDINLGGLSIISKYNIDRKIGDKLKLFIKINDEIILLEGEIINLKKIDDSGKIRFGIKFDDLSKRNIKIIKKYFKIK